MVVRPDDLKIKATAREALKRVSAFYVSGDAGGDGKASLHAFLAQKNLGIMAREARVFGRADLSQLVASVRSLDASLAA